MIYARISRDAEGDGEGVERQVSLCRELAERHQLEVVDVAVDNDIGASSKSAKKPRPEFNRMVEEVRAGRVTHVLAYSNSRLTRRMRELEDLLDLYDETEKRFGFGVVFLTVAAGEDDLSKGQGRMVARIKAAVDANESDMISERAKAKHREDARSGKVKRQVNRPFGFLEDGVTHHPVEAPLIRAAVEDILKGATITQIARKWEKAGVKTTTGNERWRWFPLRRVLLGPRTAGIRLYNGEEQRNADGTLVMGEWKPIISLEDRTRALEMLKEKAKTKTRQGNWLLSGLLRCGKCGRPLYGSLGTIKKMPPKPESFEDSSAAIEYHRKLQAYERTHTYACNSERSSHLGISARRLEEYIELEVQTYLANKRIFGVPESPEPVIQDFPKQERLEDISRKIDELMEAYNTERLSGEIVFAQVDRLDQERKELRAERDAFYARQPRVAHADMTHEQRVGFATDKLIEGLSETFEDRQLTLRQEIDSIVIAPGIRGNAGKSDEAFQKRITIIWREPHYEYGQAQQAATEV